MAKHPTQLQGTASAGNEYTLDELESDIGHCHDLIDMAVNMLHDNYMPGEKTGRERAETLVWMARDFLDQMSKKIEDGGGRPRI